MIDWLENLLDWMFDHPGWVAAVFFVLCAVSGRLVEAVVSLFALSLGLIIFGLLIQMAKWIQEAIQAWNTRTGSNDD